MNNEEAIQYLQCGAVPFCTCASNRKHGGDCGGEDCVIEAIDVAIAALERADKYRWHDLRENPDDLPQVARSASYTPQRYREKVNIIIALKNGEYRCCDRVSIGYVWSPRIGWMKDVFAFETSDSYFYPVVDAEDFEYTYQSSVIEWRYLEPSEEET